MCDPHERDGDDAAEEIAAGPNGTEPTVQDAWLSFDKRRDVIAELNIAIDYLVVQAGEQDCAPVLYVERFAAVARKRIEKLLADVDAAIMERERQRINNLNYQRSITDTQPGNLPKDAIDDYKHRTGYHDEAQE